MKFALSISLIISKLREPVPRCPIETAEVFSAEQPAEKTVVFGEEDVTVGDVTIAT